MFTSDVGCILAKNVIKPCVLNLKFQHFIPIYIFKLLLITMNWRLKEGSGMEEGHQIGQSQVILQETLVGRFLKKMRIEFVRTGFENQLL